MKQLLTELFENHYKDVYAYLYSLCHDASLSEDLASEVFLEVVKSISTFRGESDIKTWLFSIARHKWYAWLRRKKRQIPAQSIHDLWDVAEPDASGEASLTDAAAVIRSALDGESAMTRSVVQMRVEGYSYYEIAGRLQISENSARVVYFRAKTKIKKYLEKEGFSYE